MSIPNLLHEMCADLPESDLNAIRKARGFRPSETVDQAFAANRQRFLTEQDYKYEILYEDEVL